MSVVEFLKSKNVPETLIAGQDEATLKGIAKAMGFEASCFEVVTYTRKEGKNAGKPAQYLKSNIKGPDGKALRSQVFEFLCEGDSLTAEGEARRVGILVALGNGAADAIG